MVKLLPSFLSTSIALLTVIATTLSCTPQPTTSQHATQRQAASQPQQDAQWEEVGQLPLPLESHQMVVLGDFVYVLGGWNDTKGPYAEVFFTPLTPEGILDNWQPATAKLPLRLQHHAAITHDNTLYVLGGDNGFWDGSTVSDRILKAIPNPEGDITDWVDVGKLPQPLTIHAVTTIDDQIYVVGGSPTFRPGATVVDTIYTATFAPDGTIGPFQPLSTFPTSIGWLTATALDSQIFAVSGKVKFSPTELTPNLWRSQANAKHQLSPFKAVGTTTPRERHATVLVDRTLVVIAGGGKNKVLSRVDAIEIDPQGNLTEWTELAPLPAARYAHAAFAHGGHIYVSGGYVRYGSTETSRKIFRLSLRS